MRDKARDDEAFADVCDPIVASPIRETPVARGSAPADTNGIQRDHAWPHHVSVHSSASSQLVTIRCLGDQHVLRLQIAMDDAASVREGECLEQLAEPGGGAARLHPNAAVRRATSGH